HRQPCRSRLVRSERHPPHAQGDDFRRAESWLEGQSRSRRSRAVRRPDAERDVTRILIVEARFYAEISDELLKGARRALDAAGVQGGTVSVPGALEIPPAILFSKGTADGFVALGCVIRGETTHYEIVAGESARGLMDLGVHHGLAIGNGILTCENWDQAMT